MIKPLACKICGSVHWGLKHVWPIDAPDPVIDVPLKQNPGRVRLDDLSVEELRAKITDRRQKVAGYVRKHRAKKKGETE